MSDTLPKIRQFLESTELKFKIMDCNPELADTKVFCKEYGIKLEDSANAILVKTKTGELKYEMGDIVFLANQHYYHSVDSETTGKMSLHFYVDKPYG